MFLPSPGAGYPSDFGARSPTGDHPSLYLYGRLGTVAQWAQLASRMSLTFFARQAFPTITVTSSPLAQREPGIG
jgi:hypothetical protein